MASSDEFRGAFGRPDLVHARGFTLIELVIVVAILGIMAAVIIPQFRGYRAKGFNAIAQTDLRNAMTAEEAYFAIHRRYFSVADMASASGHSHRSLGFDTSKNVTLILQTLGNADYTGESRHRSGNHTYKVTGSVGLIR